MSGYVAGPSGLRHRRAIGTRSTSAAPSRPAPTLANMRMSCSTNPCRCRGQSRFGQRRGVWTTCSSCKPAARRLECAVSNAPSRMRRLECAVSNECADRLTFFATDVVLPFNRLRLYQLLRRQMHWFNRYCRRSHDSSQPSTLKVPRLRASESTEYSPLRWAYGRKRLQC